MVCSSTMPGSGQGWRAPVVRRSHKRATRQRVSQSHSDVREVLIPAVVRNTPGRDRSTTPMLGSAVHVAHAFSGIERQFAGTTFSLTTNSSGLPGNRGDHTGKPTRYGRPCPRNARCKISIRATHRSYRLDWRTFWFLWPLYSTSVAGIVPQSPAACKRDFSCIGSG